jgi:hypothetical protein
MAGHVAHMGEIRIVCKILAEKLEAKIALERSKYR